MTFALPSAVGICDLAGYMDVQIEDGFDISRLLRIKGLPDGLEVLDVKEVDEVKVSLMSLVHSVDYVIEGDMSALERLKSEQPLPFVRINKRGRRHERDARDYLLRMEWGEHALRVQLLAGSEQSIRVNELLEAVTGDREAHVRFQVTRWEVYDKEGRSLWEH